MSSWTIEVNDSDFEAQVLDRSKEVPVVVDFWAPWCGPCRVLGPVLERMADEYGGKFVLAKINVDENPGIASAFRIQGIPAVKVFKDGALFTEFTGALPEPAVRDVMERVVPSKQDEMAAQGHRLAAEGKSHEAMAIFEEVLQGSPNHAGALLGLGRSLLDTDTARALELLGRVPPGTPERKEADPLIARYTLKQAEGEDMGALRDRLKAEPEDIETRFKLGQALAAVEQYQEALEQFLIVLKKDRAFKDDGARKAMVQIFEVLGLSHEITDRFRSEMAKVLFS